MTRRPRAGSLATLAVALLAACGDDATRPAAVRALPDSADQLFVLFRHQLTRDGVRRSQVEADTALFYEGTQRAVLRNTTVHFFDDAGRETSVLTARSGTYWWTSGRVEAEGDVLVRGSGGATLRSEFLRYDDSTRQISTDRPFTYNSAGERVSGTGFRSDPELKYVVTGRPRGVSKKGFLLPGQ